MARSLAGPAGGGYGGVRIVGDYIVGRQIGAGSFAVVWQATHRVHGTEVAVKEIAMERLSKKLQESLISEIAILKGIRHPNIIALHDIIEASGKIYLVLEYCRGGDLSMYIQRHGRVPEAIAKHFMLQLAAGLQVLRANNLIHRDLKPQNLLLSANDSNSVLKIADFGFARSLQPRLLAETLCGSPLYMAPEIMQLQKYDAKADLWSVGAILFQLVTGRTPFSGSNQIQLLQNIVKSNELCFPADSNLSYECIDLCQKLLRCNPVQRLTFKEFFTHQFLSQNCTDESLRGDADPESSPVRTSGGSSQDCLPFLLDESIGQCSSPQPESKASIRSTCGFSVNTRIDNIPAYSTPNDTSGFDFLNKPETAGCVRDYQRPLGGSFKLTISSSKDSTVVDSLELVDQEYVLVPRPCLELSLSSVSVSRPSSSHYKSDSSPVEPQKFSELSALMPVTSAAISDKQAFGNVGSHISPASGTLQGSMDVKDIILQPSTNCMARIRSLQQCASVITELVKEEMENGRQLEAFSVQLVILAIWKQAMHSCHVHVASSTEGSPSLEIRTGESNSETANASECFDSINSQLSDDLCLRIKREFLHEVVHAEELSRDMGQGDENKQMPDAIEIIFQSALLLGRLGAVDEMMKNMERASTRYSKAVCLLYFLLVEAPSLALNPPFSLTNSDRRRLLSYIDMISDRQGQIGDREGQSQRMAFLQCVYQDEPFKAGLHLMYSDFFFPLV